MAATAQVAIAAEPATFDDGGLAELQALLQEEPEAEQLPPAQFAAVGYAAHVDRDRQHPAGRAKRNKGGMTYDEFNEVFQEALARERLCPPSVQVELSTGTGDAVSFDLIRVRKKGNGIARRVLQILIDLSDAHRVPLQVIPTSVYPEEPGALTNEQLEAWYRRNGFVPPATPETPRLWRRDPQAIGSAS